MPSPTQEVKARTFFQGLLDGDFLKSLAKKPISKFDALLVRAVKYINMEDAQAAKKESRGKRERRRRRRLPPKNPKMNLGTGRPPPKTPLTVPITQALIAVEGKWLLARPRSWKEGTQHPQSDKFCRFHNNYDHTMEECQHLKNEIERLIQNGYLQEYVCWEKAWRTQPYQKREVDKFKEVKGARLEILPKRGPKTGSGVRAEPSDPPRERVIRMIAGGPIGGESHHARNAEARKAYDVTIKEVFDVKVMEDAPII
ncbi:UNVERIFIED_CONTAM: hypothetical protein Sradi_3247200 [Sesamum radiatum]|uniref:Uncharacterized protein n=1 Tax=Sesamum radiatum TaxID=300843 RepID=A0AAW2R034_SESRA